MEEVRRPVERIDDPEIFGIDVLVASGSFFGENRMTRVRCMQRIDDRALGLAIDFAHEVLRTFRRYSEEIKIARAAIDDVAGAARRLHGSREHRMHGVLSPAS